MDDIRVLSQEIGARPLGSQANRQAAGYVAESLREIGLGVEEQPFACPDWTELDTELVVGDHRLVVAANAFSSSCDVTGQLVALCTMAELVAADLSGRIAVLYGELMQGSGLAAPGGIYFPERDQRILGLLEERAPLAVITIHPKIGSLEPLIRVRDWAIPSVVVAAEAGRKLLRLLACEAHLTIETESTPALAHNVVARSADSSGKRILLMAHLDTMNNTPGAIDNASGVAVLLETARRLASHGDLPCGIEWVALNGEENGGLGDVAYLEAYGDTLGAVLAAVNIDGVGGLVGANSYTVMGASEAFESAVDGIAQARPGIAKVKPWYESDHTAYLYRGVPCVALSSVGVSSLAHMPEDTVEWVCGEKLQEVVGFVLDVIGELACRETDWARP